MCAVSGVGRRGSGSGGLAVLGLRYSSGASLGETTAAASADLERSSSFGIRSLRASKIVCWPQCGSGSGEA